MLAYFSMSSHKNHEFYFLRIRINFLMTSNFSYHMQKLLEKSLDAYKLRVGEILLVLCLKTSAKIKVLLITTQYRTCIKKTE